MNIPPIKECLYEFDELLLYPSERLLVRRDGSRLDLRGKDFDVLVHLIRKQKRLVTKDELLESVWNGAFVEEGCITTSISKIRKSLLDDARNPKYIESLRGFGYRFIVDAHTLPFAEHESIRATFGRTLDKTFFEPRRPDII